MEDSNVAVEIVKIIFPPTAVIFSSIITFLLTSKFNEKKENKRIYMEKVETLFETLMDIHSSMIEINENLIKHTEIEQIKRLKIDVMRKFQKAKIYESLYLRTIGLNSLEIYAESHINFGIKNLENNKIDEIISDEEVEEDENGKKYLILPSSFNRSFQKYENLLDNIKDRIQNKIDLYDKTKQNKRRVRIAKKRKRRRNKKLEI